MTSIVDWLNGKKTYILGVAGAVLGVLVALGVLTPPQQDEASKGLLDSFNHLIGLAVGLVSLLHVFQRQGSAKAEQAANTAAVMAQQATNNSLTAAQQATSASVAASGAQLAAEETKTAVEQKP